MTEIFLGTVLKIFHFQDLLKIIKSLFVVTNATADNNLLVNSQEILPGVNFISTFAWLFFANKMSNIYWQTVFGKRLTYLANGKQIWSNSAQLFGSFRIGETGGRIFLCFDNVSLGAESLVESILVIVFAVKQLLLFSLRKKRTF